MTTSNSEFTPEEEQKVREGFKILQQKVHQLAIEKGWYQPPKSTTEAIALMHSEFSEALEEYRVRGTETYVGDGGKPEGFFVELGDAVIRACDTTEFNSGDLGDAVIRKHNFNRTRPYRHGNKRV